MKPPFVSFTLILALAEPLFASNFATKAMDATFKLFHPNSTSTCFVLRDGDTDSDFYLVTAAHTLENAKGETATLVLRKRNNDGTLKRHDYKLRIRKGNKVLWIRHKVQDVAVLKLLGPLPVAVHALPVACLADKKRLNAADVHICSPLFVLTYPERFEANAAGCPIARRGIFASSPTLSSDSHPKFLADFTTFPGDSGGPVFIPTNQKKSPLIVGMVVGQYNHVETIESKLEKRRVKRPFDLGIVLHARYVRETIDLAKTPK